MSLLNKFTIKSRLVSLLLGVSLSSLLIAGILSYLQFRSAIQKQVFEKLVGLRATKKNKIEMYMQNLRSHVETLSEDPMVVSSMVEFNYAYGSLENEIIPAEWSEAIEYYYKTKFLPQLSENIQGEPIFANYNPPTQVSQYLQYYYIANNSFPVGEKSKLTKSRDDSDYTKFHNKYHPLFRNLLQKFGYYDLYLIDFGSGEIVYSVEKKTDYATSLDRGAYRRSGLAEVVEAVRDNPGKGFVQIVDFEPYAPAYGTSAAFFAAPIYNGPHLVGILAVQLPIDKINSILSGNKNWQEEGLGKTGQVYIVGSDLLMRSDSRLLLEDAEKYFKNLNQTKIPSQIINLIKQLKTSILLQSVETTAAKSAINGVSGIEIIDDYRGVPVISAYAPLRIEGLKWSLIAEIERSEAFQPILAFQIYFSILVVILLLLITWLADLTSHNFVKPIQTLIDAAQQIKEGKNIKVALDRQDELGELGNIFSDIAEEMNTQQQLLAKKKQENETFLANILPPNAIAQFQNGEKQIADSLAKVTILYAKIAGINSLSQEKSATEMGVILNQLVASCDRYAGEYGLEKQNTIWGNYVAVCGLSESHLDQQERTVNFTFKMIEAIEQINREYQVYLGWRIAIHSGKLMSGIVGDEKFSYKLWGTTADIVTNLNAQGFYNSIIVTESIKNRLSDSYLFVPSEAIKVEDAETIATWMLISTTSSFSQQIQLVQKSCTKLMSQADATAKLFSERLLAIAPQVCLVFQSNLNSQPTKLMDTLQVAVNGLSNLPELFSTVQDLGRRYANYGVIEEEYKSVGEVLIWTLEQKLGEDFTPEVKQGWIYVYTLLSSVMRDAAKSTKDSQNLSLAIEQEEL